LTARKRFGQNFLTDPVSIQRVVDTINPQANHHILEIGPGHGAITKALISSGCHLVAIEIDRDLVASLDSMYGTQLQILSADALKVDYASICSPHRYRVVGNLPYNISTPLLFKLFSSIDHFSDMTFMLQEEVVNRICADAGESNYGRLSVMSQYFCVPEKQFKVAPTAFNPQPKVTSAIISLTPHQHPVRAKSLECLEKIVASAFNQRRKTIRNALKLFLSAQDLESLEIDSGRRPQTIHLKEYIKCADLVWQRQQS